MPHSQSCSCKSAALWGKVFQNLSHVQPNLRNMHSAILRVSLCSTESSCCIPELFIHSSLVTRRRLHVASHAKMKVRTVIILCFMHCSCRFHNVFLCSLLLWSSFLTEERWEIAHKGCQDRPCFPKMPHTHVAVCATNPWKIQTLFPEESKVKVLF